MPRVLDRPLLRYCLAGSVLFLAAAATRVSAQATPRKWALLVGVSEMQKSPRAKWLSGPVNDLPAMSRMLQGRFGVPAANLRTLSGKGATKAAIQSAFSDLKRQAQPGDLVLFYYSGHGTQLPDQNGDEADGKDEALVPYDAGGTIASYLSDDELGAWVGALPTKDVVVVLDSCHSGTGLRGGGAVPRAIDAETLGLVPKPLSPELVNVRADNLGSDLIGPTVLTGCSSSETSADSTFLLKTKEQLAAFEAQQARDPYFGDRSDNPYHGALTYFIMRAVEVAGDHLETYSDLHLLVSGAIKKSGFTQTPQLEGFIKRPLFGGKAPAVAVAPVTPVAPVPIPTPTPVPTPQQTPVQAQVSIPSGHVARITAVSGSTVSLEAAPGRSVLAGSLLELPAGTGAGAVLRVRTAQGRAISAELLRGTVRVGETVVESFRPFVFQKLRVAVTGNAPEAARRELVSSLGTLGRITLVSPNADRDVELELTSEFRIIPFRNQQRLAPLGPSTLEKLWPRVQDLIDSLYLTAQLTALENPSTADDLRVELRVNGQIFDTTKVGSEVAFTARANQECYLYLLDVDPAGKVTVLFPNKFVAANRLRAGEVTKLPAPELFRLRVAGPAGTEVLKAVVSRKPLRLEAITAANGELATIGGGAEFVQQFLQQLRREINRNSTNRNIEVLPAPDRDNGVAADGWATDTLLMQIMP